MHIPSFIDPFSVKRSYYSTVNTASANVFHYPFCNLSNYNWFIIYLNAWTDASDRLRVTYHRFSFPQGMYSDPDSLAQTGNEMASVYCDRGIIPLNFFGTGLTVRYDNTSGFPTQTCVSTMVYGLPYEMTKKLPKTKRYELYNR